MVTDISTSSAEVIFRVKWKVFFKRSGVLNLVSHNRSALFKSTYIIMIVIVKSILRHVLKLYCNRSPT